MTRVALPLLSLALGFCVLGAVRKSEADIPATVHARHTSVAAGSIATVSTAVAPSTRKADEHAETLRRLRDLEPGTYIADILLERDSALTRWPDRHGIPLTVWIQPHSSVGDFISSYVSRVRDAFRAWDAVELPVGFAFVEDSASADIHVNWIDRFTQPISGRTRWAHDDDFAITDANIVLAVHHSQGEQLDEEAMSAMALHEIGHLLGLDHTTDDSSIMAPRVRVRELSAADRATVRLLYALPAGRLR